MKILAIETSCDETAVAIVEDGTKVLANQVASQVNWHRKYGGVVPEMAARMHAEKIHFLLNDVLKESGLDWKEIDACAVTYGPGLEGALLIGLGVAKMTAHLLGIPLVGINHLQGHIYANFLMRDCPKFPFVTLIASGGHTLLVLVKDHCELEILGNTRDDACGEAFDKVARVLGLSYPGGPEIEKMAKSGDETAFNFPRAMIGKGLDFSFSGLKTAVIQQVQLLNEKGECLPVSDLCASFQRCVIDILVKKSFLACKKAGVKTLVLSGGVTANRRLMKQFEEEAQCQKVVLYVPPVSLCTDNAAMIGAAAFYQCQKKQVLNRDLRVVANLPVCE